MDSDPTASIQLELKYCERCGGLWLRPHANEGVYCRACTVILQDFPKVRLRPPWKRRKTSHQPQCARHGAHPKGASV
jgi:hypothetical protein